MEKEKRYRYLFFLIFIFSINCQLFAQNGNNRALEKARQNFLKGDYYLAIQQYTSLLKTDSNNVEFNYELAQSYYFSDSLKLKAIPYFERTLKNLSKDNIVELHYYLGKTYQLANRFEEAITSYKMYLQLYKPESSMFSNEDAEGNDFVKEVEKNILACKSARTVTQRPVNKIEMNGKVKTYEVLNLGENVNSKFDDYGAVISPDDSTLYFTSRRKVKKRSKKDGEDDKYYEDIYVSKSSENGWGNAMSIGSPINTAKNHEAVNFISSDGYKLYFCRGVKNGTFYTSDRKGDKWESPQVLEKAKLINSSDWKTSLLFSASENVIYVVTDKEGGFGKRDIYKSTKMANGTWGTLENLGPTINTEYDEDAPFVTSDGKTLYFSSSGHSSIGGFDVFKSQKQLVSGASEWAEPKNMGYPINTTGNDLFFTLDKDNTTAYYSSSRAGEEGNNDDMDIYSISLCDESPTASLKGLITNAEAGPIDMVISVVEKKTEKQVARFIVAKDGKYELNLLRDIPYIISFQGKKTVYFTHEFTLPKQCNPFDFFQKVELSKRVDFNKNQWVQKALIKNAFFDINKKTNSLGKNKTVDAYQNYVNYLNTIDPKLTRLNYKESIVETCLSDIYDVSDLALSFYDTLNNNIETAQLSKSGVFVFYQLNLNQPGVFKLAGQDPGIEYQVNVAIGLDTIRTEQVKNGFIFPRTRLIASNQDGTLLETAILNNKGGFIFRKADLSHPCLFRLEGGEKNNAYQVKLTKGGKGITMQYQNGALFPYKTLGYYNFKDSLSASSLLARDSIFRFNLTNDMIGGRFSLLGDEQDTSIYGLKILKNLVVVKDELFQNGKVFSKRVLGFYNSEDDLVETARMNQDRTFTFKKVKLQEPGIYKIQSPEADSVSLIHIYIGNAAKEIVRSGDGFVRADKMPASQVDSLIQVTYSKQAAQENELYDELKKDEEKQRQALEVILASNSIKFQQQIAEKKNQKEEVDTLPLLPLRKLRFYNTSGSLLETAGLMKRKVFVFKGISPNEFGLFRLEGEEADTTLPYEIDIVKADSSLRRIKFTDLHLQDGYLFEKRNLNFYNVNGDVVETATLTKEGIFTFHKLKGDEKGLFKLQENEDSAVYGINILRSNNTVSEVQFQNGKIFSRQTLSLFNAQGALVEKEIAGPDGNFVFHKLPPDNYSMFQLDGATELDADYGIKIMDDKSKTRSLRLKDMVMEDGFIYEPDPNGEKAKKKLSLYNAQGELMETATATRSGKFVFHKLAPEEFGSFKFVDGYDTSRNYAIEIINDGILSKTMQIKEMKMQDEAIFPKKQLSYYDAKGKIIETAELNKNGEFIFKKINPEEQGLFKMQSGDADLAVYKINVMKNNSPSKALQYKEGITFPEKTLSFYNAKGVVVETALLNSEGKFVFNKLAYDEPGSFKFDNGEAPDPQANYAISILHDGFNMRTIKVKEMDSQDGSMVAMKKLNCYNKDGIIVETALINKEGNFVFHKLSPEENNIFRMQGEEANLTANFGIQIIDQENKVREIKFKEMRAEEGFIFEDKKLSFYNSQGLVTETASINKEGNFNFYKLKSDEPGSFVLNSDEPDQGLYKINIIKTDASKKTLQYQEGIAFPESYMSFYNAKGTLLETTKMNKEGEFVFHKLSPEDKGSFKMLGEESQDPSLNNLRIIASNKPVEALRVNKSIVRMDELKNNDLLALDDKDSGKYATVKNEFALLNENYSKGKTSLMETYEASKKNNVLKLAELKKQALVETDPAKKASIEKEIALLNKSNAIARADLMQKLNTYNKNYAEKKAALATVAITLIAKNDAVKKAEMAKTDAAIASSKEELNKKAEAENQALVVKTRNDSIRKLIAKEVQAVLAKNETETALLVNVIKAKAVFKENVKETAKGTVKEVVKESSKATEGITGPFPNILFAYGASDVQDEFVPNLNDIIAYAKANRKDIIQLIGHTDSKGDAAYNIALSAKRVHSVVKYLVEGGVPRKHIHTRGLGKGQPAAPNENPDGTDNPDGRRLNRRVEVQIFRKNR